MTNPVLYSFRRCPYAMRARMALHVSSIRCELREIVLRNKPQEFIALSAKSTVPVLALTDDVIDESLEIMRWALDQHDPERWMPGDTATQRDSEDLIEQCDTHFKFNLDRYKYTNRYPGAVMADHRAKAGEFLTKINDRVAKGGFLHGSEQRITDVAIAPFVRQFANTDMVWFRDQGWSSLSDWLEQFIESRRFADVMVKYNPWESGASPVYFPK